MKTCDSRRSARRIASALASSAALCVMLASPAAHAQAQDQAAARALFEDGRRLLKEGKYPEACRTLEAASKLYASPGILLNLGDCYEKLGRSASAWTEFGEAAAEASRGRRNDQVSEAKRRQAAIEPKLTRLTIRVTNAVTGLAVTRDQTDLASAAWGQAIPVDPGTHEVHAEAPGHEPWTTSVVVSTPGQTVMVEVPALTASPTPAPPPQGREAEASSNAAPTTSTGLSEVAPARPRSRAVDWVLVGGGVAIGVVGGVLWDLGSSHSHDASDADTTTPKKFATAQSEYDSARTLFYIGVAGAAVGAATATAGILLMTVARGHATTPTTGAVRASPWLSPGAGGVQVAGGF
jgi:tetratricopeptide (TPR) repeat protein